MKHSIFISSVIAFAFTIFASCKKANSPDTTGANFIATASFVIDGDNFKNQTITIKGFAKTNTQCSYSFHDEITQITITDQPDINTKTKNQFFLIFNGNSPATQHAGDDPNGGTFNSIYFQVSVSDKDGVLHPYLFENADRTPGAFSISKYGKPGETVEGSFSGILVDEGGDPAIKISGGNFSISRNKDVD